MKPNKWKSNEANDKSLTGAKTSVERQKKKLKLLRSRKIKSNLGLSSVVNIYWLITTVRHIIAYSWRRMLI